MQLYLNSYLCSYAITVLCLCIYKIYICNCLEILSDPCPVAIKLETETSQYIEKGGTLVIVEAMAVVEEAVTYVSIRKII